MYSLPWRGGCGESRGSGTLVASCNYFPSLAGCSFLQTHPMSLCPVALDSDQLQMPAPRGDSPFKSSFRMPLMCVSCSLGTCSADYQVVSSKVAFFKYLLRHFSIKLYTHLYKYVTSAIGLLLRPKEVQGDRCLGALPISEGGLAPKVPETNTGEGSRSYSPLHELIHFASAK